MVISEVSLKLECTTKTKMTKLMKTSCAALDRLLNSDNDSPTLSTLESAAAVLDKRLSISITRRLPININEKSSKILDEILDKILQRKGINGARLVTSFYPERVKIYTLKNIIEIPFLGTYSNEKCF